MKYIFIVSLLSLIGATQYKQAAEQEVVVPVQLIEFTTPMIITPSK